MKVLVSILVSLVLVAPASAQIVSADNHSSRTLRQHKPKPEVRNWKFFRAIGRCEQPAPASARRANGTWPKKYMWGIDWFQRRNYSFPGGLGVWAPLWHEEGIAGTDMAPSADRATPREQMIHAQRIINRYGVYAWSCAGRALAEADYIDVK